MDNFAGAQSTMLSTAEPGTPAVSRGHLREKQTTKEHNGQQPNTVLMDSTLTPLSGCPKDGDHLSRDQPQRPCQALPKSCRRRS